MDKVLGILNGYESKVDTVFFPYILEVQSWITGVIAIAFLLYLVFTVILPMMSGREFDLTKFMVMLVLYGMFKMYPTLIKSIDNFYQILPNKAMEDVKKQIQSVNLIFTKPAPKGKDIGFTDIPVATLNAIQQIPITMYILSLTAGIYILFAIIVLIKLSSVIAANVIMVLGSIPFALSFLPGFSGGVPSLLKNLLAVRLWPFVAGLLFKVFTELGVFTELFIQMDKLNQMSLDPTKLQSWNYDLSAIILLIVAMFIIGMTPKFVDMGLNVNVSGGAGNMMGASSIIGGISSLISGGAMTAAQSALGIGDGAQQSQQNQLLTSINSGIGDLTKALLNNGAGGKNGGEDSSGSPVDKSTSE